MVLESKKALKKQGDGACQGDTGPKLKELSMAKFETIWVTKLNIIGL